MKQNHTLTPYIIILFYSLLLLQGCDSHHVEKEAEGSIHETAVAWAVGNMDAAQYATLYKTVDGGSSWVRIDTNNTALQGFNAETLYVISSDNLWVAGSSQRLIHTSDSGRTWKQYAPFHEKNSSVGLYDISARSPFDLWVCGDNGTLIHTEDGGKSWNIMDPEVVHHGLIQGVNAAGIQKVYIVGNYNHSTEGFAYSSEDNGKSWKKIDDINTSHIWIGVKSIDANHTVIYGAKGNYTFTSDGGKHWKEKRIEASGGENGADINDLVMVDAMSWWCAMDLDNIFFTDDGGNHWQKQESDAKDDMYLVGIDALDTTHALITGLSARWPQEGKIILTTDGGESWIQQLHSDSPIQKVSFVH